MFDGQKIKKLRTERSLSLKELSEKSGVSVSMISQIERRNTDPTLTTLYKLCAGLNISISALLGTDEPSSQIIRQRERKSFHFPVSHSKYELLTPTNKGEIEMIMIYLEPGQEDRQLVEHSGEECGLVLEGEMTVHLNGESHILKAGDSIRFKSTLPHRFYNHSESRAVSVWAMTGWTV
ncbi:HTH-type transcriptional regulator PuuR [Planococcus massiliensis]|uniref:HTH-type transcriptional regulator PuuR n=1 Tax=Planococcus massiliensis TaxID=1499687 RepID=A0A098ER01_9BACL|nr:cupin domain-containing protein [Planococcus massiliensis]CEG23726.1 HTH-type transcriptional regulator PuuR [Planococcus massiliensis]